MFVRSRARRALTLLEVIGVVIIIGIIGGIAAVSITSVVSSSAEQTAIVKAEGYARAASSAIAVEAAGNIEGDIAPQGPTFGVSGTGFLHGDDPLIGQLEAAFGGERRVGTWDVVFEEAGDGDFRAGVPTDTDDLVESDIAPGLTIFVESGGDIYGVLFAGTELPIGSTADTAVLAD